MVRKEEEKKTHEEMDGLSSHPCVVAALANQTGARDRRPDQLSSRAMPNADCGGMRLMFLLCFVVVIRPAVMQ